MIICDISLFVRAANRETILVVTYASLHSRRWLGGAGGESVNCTGYPTFE